MRRYFGRHFLSLAVSSRAALALALGFVPTLGPFTAHAQQPMLRFAVTTQQITLAMKKHQLAVGDVQLELAAPITATVEDPRLEIQNVSLESPRLARLRMACTNHAECLPFFVLASWPDRKGAPGIPPELMALLDSSHSLLSDHPQTRTQGDTSSLPSAIHVGAPVTLQLEGYRIHVTLQVICLEAGPPGARIRVTSKDHKRMYQAVVVGPSLLKGTL